MGFWANRVLKALRLDEDGLFGKLINLRVREAFETHDVQNELRRHVLNFLEQMNSVLFENTKKNEKMTSDLVELTLARDEVDEILEYLTTAVEKLQKDFEKFAASHPSTVPNPAQIGDGLGQPPLLSNGHNSPPKDDH